MFLKKYSFMACPYYAMFFMVAIVAIVPFALFSLTAGLLVVIIISFAAILLFQQPSRAILILIFLLPVHSLIITILIGQIGLPLEFARIVAAWKESLLVLTILVVLVKILIQQRIAVLTWLDWVSFLWLTQIFLYFLLGNFVFGWQSSLITRLYGARDWLLYLIPYFIGRFIKMPERNAKKILLTILMVGLITSVYGIIEYFFLPIEFHINIGVPRYFRDFLNLSYPDYLSGLPPNYWAEVAGRPVRRAVSTYLSGQGFAVPFLLLLPMILVHYFSQPTKKNLSLVAICAIALLLTITRMTILACFMQGLAILLLLHRYRLLIQILALVTVLSIVILSGNATIRTFVFDTILLQDTSSSARPAQWMHGIQTMLDMPLGAGLGYAGQVGARFGGSGGGQEAGYFKITGDLGIPGLFFFLTWFGGILLFSFNLYRISTGVWKTLALGVFVTAIGFLFNNLTAPPDQSLFLIYLFPFLSGVIIRRYIFQRIARREHRHKVSEHNLSAEKVYDAGTMALGQA